MKLKKNKKLSALHKCKPPKDAKPGAKDWTCKCGEVFVLDFMSGKVSHWIKKSKLGFHMSQTDPDYRMNMP